MYTLERHLPTPGQRGHSPQRHTTAGTAAPTTTDTGNTVPQRANSGFNRSELRVVARVERFVDSRHELDVVRSVICVSPVPTGWVSRSD